MGQGRRPYLRCLIVWLSLPSGAIRIGGRDVKHVSLESLRREIGYVIQQAGLFPHYTIEENIGVIPSLLNWSNTQIAQRVRTLVQAVGLSEELLKRFPRELSGGQQQRVGIARALAADPPVVLMDEPFGALDPITKQQMAQEFAQLGLLRKKTVVLVTHDVLEAFVLGDQVCLLDGGKMQQLGSPKELLFRPENRFVKEFFRTQKLRLALEVLTVKDIIPYCTPGQHSTTDAVIRINEGQRMFEVLDALESATVECATIAQRGAADIILKREQLLRGVFIYQTNTR